MVFRCVADWQNLCANWLRAPDWTAVIRWCPREAGCVDRAFDHYCSSYRPRALVRDGDGDGADITRCEAKAAREAARCLSSRRRIRYSSDVWFLRRDRHRWPGTSTHQRGLRGSRVIPRRVEPCRSTTASGAATSRAERLVDLLAAIKDPASSRLPYAGGGIGSCSLP